MKIKRILFLFIIITIIPLLFVACGENKGTNEEDSSDYSALPSRPNEDAEEEEDDEEEPIQEYTFKLTVVDNGEYASTVKILKNYVAVNYNENMKINSNESAIYRFMPAVGSGIRLITVNSEIVFDGFARNSHENFDYKIEEVKEDLNIRVLFEPIYSVFIDETFNDSFIDIEYDLLNDNNYVFKGGSISFELSNDFDLMSIKDIEVATNNNVRTLDANGETGDNVRSEKMGNKVRVSISNITDDVYISANLKQQEFDAIVKFKQGDNFNEDIINSGKKTVYIGGDLSATNSIIVKSDNFINMFYSKDTNGSDIYLVPFEFYFYNNGYFYFPILSDMFVETSDGDEYTGDRLFKFYYKESTTTIEDFETGLIIDDATFSYGDGTIIIGSEYIAGFNNVRLFYYTNDPLDMVELDYEKTDDNKFIVMYTGDMITSFDSNINLVAEVSNTIDDILVQFIEVTSDGMEYADDIDYNVFNDRVEINLPIEFGGYSSLLLNYRYFVADSVYLEGTGFDEYTTFTSNYVTDYENGKIIIYYNSSDLIEDVLYIKMEESLAILLYTDGNENIGAYGNATFIANNKIDLSELIDENNLDPDKIFILKDVVSVNYNIDLSDAIEQSPVFDFGTYIINVPDDCINMNVVYLIYK